MKQKIYAVIKTKTFREKNYGKPNLTLCKTREIARREFFKSVESELDDYIEDDELDGYNDDMSLQEKVDLYSEYYFDVSFSDKPGQERCSFQTSDESSTSFSIIETELIITE